MIVPKFRFLSAFVLALILIGLLAIAAANPVQAVDEFDTMRVKYFNYLTGSDLYTLPITDPDVQDRVTAITSEAQTQWTNMNKSAGRTYLWSEVTAASMPVSAYMVENYNRVYAMTLAYSTKGSTLQGNSTLLNDLKSALDWLYTNQYNETLPRQDNTHYWELSIPGRLTSITTLLYDHLSSTQITNYMNAVHAFAYDATNYSNSSTISYGANRLWETLPIAVRGILIKDSSRLAYARDIIGDYDAKIYNFVKSTNGWYRDGSFISHDHVPYIGGYGLGHFSTFITLNELLSGSTWAITDPKGENVYDWVYDGYVPWMHKGLLMYLVNGRTISTANNTTDYSYGNSVIGSILTLIDSSSASDALKLKQYLKGWVLDNTTYNYLDSASLTPLIKIKAILQDTNVTPLKYTGYRQYGSMDRAVQQTEDHTFAISMYSKRVYDYEMIGSPSLGTAQNKKGWYTGYGMTFLYNNDLQQYNGNFWATVDMKRLAGTTVDAGRTPSVTDDYNLSSKNWVGGVEIGGLYGATGMELEGYGTTMTARKSWFAFDDEIVALGSDIDSSDSRTIETIVENRKLNASGNNTFTVNGSAKPTTLPWSQTMTSVNWMHLQGNTTGSDIGYYFPDSTTVKGLRETRTGSWNDLADVGPTTPLTDRYLTLWLDHGTNPVNASYSYVLLPNKTTSQVSSYASTPDITVLENSSYVQAVKENNLNIVAANFWQNITRTVDIITTDKKASIGVKETGNELEVFVSDPTQENNGIIDVEINKTAARIISSDPAIKVTQLTPTIKLSVQVNGAAGMTKKVKFNTASAAEPAVVTYTPTADASVHAGNQATTNYGTATTLSAVDTIDPLLDRKAYLKFDVTNAATVTSAKLRLHASSQTGKAAALTVMGAGDSWTETGITWSNAPSKAGRVLDTVFVNGLVQYYELDVTDYVSQQTAGDNIVTLLIEASDFDGLNVLINSRENSVHPPKLVVTGTFSGITPTTPPSPTYGQLYTVSLNESFDTGTLGTSPSGWTITGTGGSAVIYSPSSGTFDRDVKLTTSGASTFVQADKSFTALTVRSSVEFKVRANQTDEPIIISLSDGSSLAAAVITFEEDGRITASSGSYISYLQPYEADAWYKVKLVIDPSTDTMNVYIDDVWKGRQLALTRAITQISSISFHFASNSADIAYIDDVRAGKWDELELAPASSDITNRDSKFDITQPPYKANYHFNDTAMPSGWSTVGSGGSVGPAATPSSTNKSLRFLDSSAALGTEASLTLSDSSGRVVLDYSIMAAQTNMTFGAPYLYGYKRNAQATVLDSAVLTLSSDGNIKAYNGATSSILLAYNANEWYNIRLILDTVTDTYDVYINNKLYASQYAFRDTLIDYVNKIKFFSSTTTTGTWYLDNVRLYPESERNVYTGISPQPEIMLLADSSVEALTEFPVGVVLRNPEHTITPERVMLKYDPSRFTFKRIDIGTVAGLTFDVKEISSGYLSVGISGASGITGHATLFNAIYTPLEVTTTDQGDFRVYSADLYAASLGKLIQTELHRRSVGITPYTSYLANDDFNTGSSLPAGWATVTTGGTVQQVNTPSATDRSLQIQDTSTTNPVEAVRTITAASGTVVIRYDAMASQTTSSVGSAYVRDTLDKDTAVVYFSSDGNLKAYNGATATTLRTYSTSTWYDVLIVLNTSTDTYDVYINDVLLANDFAFRNNATSIQSMKFFLSGASTGTMNLNNLRVYTE